MVYTPEEKDRMDELLHAFRPYIDAQSHFDVVWSNKAGYLRIITENSCDPIFFPIPDWESMLRMFIDDHLQDEEECPISGQADLCRVHRKLTAILSTLTHSREQALHLLDSILAKQ